MTHRIELILKTQNLTPTQFADAIGIQRSSMSHILARRNNPSLDFVMKVLNRFPEINAEWLLTGKNQMLNIGTSYPASASVEAPQKNLQAPEFEWNDKFEDATTSKPAFIGTDNISASVDNANTSSNINRSLSPSASLGISSVEVHPPAPNQQGIEPHNDKSKPNQNSDIEKIIVFFTDGTFKSYT